VSDRLPIFGGSGFGGLGPERLPLPRMFSVWALVRWLCDDNDLGRKIRLGLRGVQCCADCVRIRDMAEDGSEIVGGCLDTLAGTLCAAESGGGSLAVLPQQPMGSGSQCLRETRLHGGSVPHFEVGKRGGEYFK